MVNLKSLSLKAKIRDILYLHLGGIVGTQLMRQGLSRVKEIQFNMAEITWLYKFTSTKKIVLITKPTISYFYFLQYIKRQFS